MSVTVVTSGGNINVGVAREIVSGSGTVENSDTTYSNTVNSGDTLVVPDAILTDFDESNTFSIVSIKNLRLATIVASETITKFTGLTSAQDGYIADFIGAEIYDGNWFNSKYMLGLFMGATNSLIDWHGHSVATAYNAPTFGADGVALDGINQYIDTNYDMGGDFSNLGATVLSFMHTNNVPSTDYVYMWGDGIANGSRYHYQRPGSTRMGGRFFTSNEATAFGFSSFTDKKLFGMHRDANIVNSSGVIYEAQRVSNTGTAVAASTGVTMKIGQRGDGTGNFINATISSFNIGEFTNWVAHDTNLRALMTAWGVTL